MNPLLFITTTSAGAFSFQIAYFAVLLFQFVYIVLQFTYAYRKEYIYYLLYIICLALYYLAANEELLQTPLIFTKHVYLQKFFDKPSVIMCSFLYYRFARHFLDVHDRFPRFEKQMIRMEYFLLCGAVAEIIFLGNFGENIFEETMFVGLSLFMCVYSIYLVYQLQSFSLNNFVAAGAFLIVVGAFSSMVLFNLKGRYYIPENIIPTIPSQIASVIELLIFTTALSYKTYLMERQKLKTERALVKELRENEALQHNLQQLRNKIAGDLHDDMGATLGSINVYADISERMMEEGNKADAKNYLNRIVELSKESLSDMRNMIWSLNPDRDTIEDLTNRMKDYAVPLLNAKSMQLHFVTESHLLRKKISVLQKRNLFLIFKESIHNVVKYASCNNVHVQLLGSRKHLTIEIRDDGKGFDMQQKKDGNGLNNMQRRAQEMDGEITIISAIEKGTIIRVEL